MNSIEYITVNYEDLNSIDKIDIIKAPEKKGIIYKHVEYEVKSQRYKTIVQRRFKDFALLHELLLSRFPFRLIPLLPAKRIVGKDIRFVEDRRKSLERFMNLIARHPIISNDSLIKNFLTLNDGDVSTKLKDTYRNSLDEYRTNDSRKNSGDLMKMDMAKYPTVKEQLNTLQDSLKNLSKIADKIVQSQQTIVIDKLDFGKQINNIMSQEESLLLNSFNSTINSEKFYSKIISISEEMSCNAKALTSEVVEPINSYIDMLAAYKELCNRYESDLRKSSKETNQKKNNNTQTESLEDLEKRSGFALHCILHETMIVKSYSTTLPMIIRNLFASKKGSHSRLSLLYTE